MKTITDESIKSFEQYLINEEKSHATVSKYVRDAEKFALWLDKRGLDKASVLDYKSRLVSAHTPSGANSVLSSLNRFLAFIGRSDIKVKSVKTQRQIFTRKERELTRQEYERLLSSAERSKNKRLYLLMQTVCSTGIRISELKYITVSAISNGYAEINCKGKRRTVFLPKQLCKALKSYAKGKNIKSGPIFVTKNGNPLDRSNIWSDMKKLCKNARVSEKKVFPHNLRHLFARTYYSLRKDIVRLADILGHSSVDTTRIYTAESGAIHQRQIERLGLLRC